MFLKFFFVIFFILYALNTSCRAQSWHTLNDGIFQLSWADDGGESIQFMFSTKTTQEDKIWSAFALSNDKYMVELIFVIKFITIFK
jgi:hypothetical protein